MKVQLISLLCLSFASLVHSSYIIDDSNTTAISYLVGGPGTPAVDLWEHHNASDPLAGWNDTYVYDRTISWGQSKWPIQWSQAWLSVQFYGSGITLYGFKIYKHNASYSIDQGSPVWKDFDGGSDFIDNVVSNYTLYDVQDLPVANHSLKVTLYDYGPEDATGEIYLDYVVVNGADAPPPPAPPSSTGSKDGKGGSSGNGAETLYYNTSGALLLIMFSFALLL